VAHIFQALREMIVDLRIAPGALLSKNRLAEEFGVSQTPLREALLRLEEEGLVDIYPQSRTAVSRIDVQHAREAFVLRLSIDVEVARNLAPVIDDGQLAELRSLLARQAAEMAAADLTAFTWYDHAFHQRIYEFGGVGGLWGVVRSRHGHLDRLRRLHLPEKGKAGTILAHHQAIIDGLASRDAFTAEAAARAHLGAALAASDTLRRQFPDYFA
jgi:DNA-binding GntR family transcriptional regulator